jgi:Secretion system C-terminal sorting domain/SprB repeat
MKFLSLVIILSLLTNLLFSQTLFFESVELEFPCHSNNNGSIYVQVAGGMSPYDFEWSNGTIGQNVNSIYNLSEGNFSVTVTDNSGASIDTSLNLTEVNITISALINEIACFGFMDGSLTLSLQEGIPPFQYQLININGGDTIGISPIIWDSVYIFDNLAAGEYEFAVSDSRGCMYDTIIFIADPPPLIVDLGPDIQINIGDSSQLIYVVNQPPIDIDSVNWYPDINISCTNCESPIITPTGDICYSVEVWNSNGCYATDTICVNVLNTSIRETLFSDIKIYPSLVTDYLKIEFNNDLTYNISILDGSGKMIFNSQSNDIQINVSDFTPGFYFIKIDLKSGTFIKRVIKI